MISFDIQGQQLSCDDSTVINMELTNSIFIADADVLPGSYSFPFNVVLDDDTKHILKHPDRIDVFKNYAEFDNVVLQFDGKPLFKGKILVMSSGDKFAKLSFVVNDFKPLEDVNIQELDNLGSISWSNASQLIALMNDTVIHPEDHDVVFCPVFNPEYLEEPPVEPVSVDNNYFKHRTQNYWDPGDETFVYNDETLAITPFVKIQHLFYKIFEYFGFGLVDGFFEVEEELKRLYLYNNKSVNTINGETPSFHNSVNPFTGGLSQFAFNINRYLPSLKCVEFIKYIRSTFFLAIIPNAFKRNISVFRYNDILTRPVRFDFTDKYLVSHENDSENNLPKEFGYDDAAPIGTEFQKLNNDAPVHTGLYSIERNAHHTHRPLQVSEFSMSYKKILFPEGGKDPYLTKLVPLYNTFPDFWLAYYGMGQFPYPNIPFISNAGNIKYVKDGEVKTQADQSDVRMLFYKGLHTGWAVGNFGGFNSTYPYATPGEHGPEQSDRSYLPLADQNSLLWNGPKGIYEKRAKEYIATLQYQKTLKCKLALTITDILNYRYEDKIRIQSNNYLAKSLKITLTKQGLQPVEVELVRVN